MRPALFLAFLAAGVTLSLFLGGCASLEERPTKTGTETRIVTLERSYNAQAECAAQLAAPPGWKVAACSSWNAMSCVIKVQPDASDDTWGHELRHCFDGKWHK